MLQPASGYRDLLPRITQSLVIPHDHLLTDIPSSMDLIHDYHGQSARNEG